MMRFAFNDAKASSRYGKFLYFSIIAYIFSIYIKNAPVVSNAFMFLILVFGVLSIPVSKYKQQLQNQKVNLGMIAFFLLQCISVVLSSDKAMGFNILSLRLPLLIFPLAFCFINFEQRTWNNILLFFVLVTAFASLIGFGYGCYLAMHENNTAYYYNDNISELLLGKQAAYFGLYINAAIIATVYLLSNKENKFQQLKGLFYVLIIWLLFVNYMLASKMSTISLLLILLTIAFIRIIRNKRILEGFILLFAMVIGLVVLYKLFPKTVERFKTITQTSFKFDNTNAENSLDNKFDANKWSSGSTRMALWTCGKEVFVQHPIMGTGLGDIRNTLKEKYTEKNFLYALNTNKNLHCQYFDVAVSMGVIGLLVFLFTYFFYPIKIFIKRRQDFAVCVFICIGLCLLTENMFDRYQGEQVIPFLLSLSIKIFDTE